MQFFLKTLVKWGGKRGNHAERLARKILTIVSLKFDQVSLLSCHITMKQEIDMTECVLLTLETILVAH